MVKIMEKIKIKDFMDLSDIQKATDFVIQLVFNSDGEYTPYIKPFAIDYASLLFFTDFPDNEMYQKYFNVDDEKFNLDEFFRFMNSNDAIHEVLLQMGIFSQYKNFISTLEETIQYKINSQYHSNKILEVIAWLDSLIENKDLLNEIFSTAKDKLLAENNGVENGEKTE